MARFWAFSSWCCSWRAKKKALISVPQCEVVCICPSKYFLKWKAVAASWCSGAAAVGSCNAAGPWKRAASDNAAAEDRTEAAADSNRTTAAGQNTGAAEPALGCNHNSVPVGHSPGLRKRCGVPTDLLFARSSGSYREGSHAEQEAADSCSSSAAAACSAGAADSILAARRPCCSRGGQGPGRG